MKLTNIRLSRFTILTAAVVAALSVQAQPAVYTDGEMTIPEGAVINAGQSTYYTDITLAAEADGSLRITSAERNPLVTVDNLELNISDTLIPEVSVTVSGNLSNPCVELLSPAIAYETKDGVILVTVVLAESLLGPAETCIAVLEPFTTEIDLAVDTAAGDVISVRVNNVEAGSTLP